MSKLPHESPRGSGESTPQPGLGLRGSWLVVGLILALFVVYVVTHWDSVELIVGGFATG